MGTKLGALAGADVAVAQDVIAAIQDAIATKAPHRITVILLFVITVPFLLPGVLTDIWFGPAEA